MGCIEELEERMASADYEYEYTEDHDVWQRGVNQRAELIVELRRIPMNIAVALIEKHVPHQYRRYYKMKLMEAKK